MRLAAVVGSATRQSKGFCADGLSGVGIVRTMAVSGAAAAQTRYSFARPAAGFASTAPFQADVKSFAGEFRK